MGESKQGSRGGTVGHTACNYTHLRMTPACTGDGSYSAPLRCLVMTSEDGSWDKVGAIYSKKCSNSWQLSEEPLVRLDAGKTITQSMHIMRPHSKVREIHAPRPLPTFVFVYPKLCTRTHISMQWHIHTHQTHVPIHGVTHHRRNSLRAISYCLPVLSCRQCVMITHEDTFTGRKSVLILIVWSLH